MGTIRKGVNGGFSGKAGSVIGGNWRDVDYIRGLPRLSGKPATLKQLQQRAKFAAAVAFLHPLKQLLELGYKTARTGQATGYNLALNQVLKEAIIGDYPVYDVDFTKVQVSKGGLSGAIGAAVEVDQDGKLVVSWTPFANEMDSFATDMAVIVNYNVTKRLFIYGAQQVQRSIGNAVVDLPEAFAGDSIETWIFFTSMLQDKISPSQHVGSVKLP